MKKYFVAVDGNGSFHMFDNRPSLKKGRVWEGENKRSVTPGSHVYLKAHEHLLFGGKLTYMESPVEIEI